MSSVEPFCISFLFTFRRTVRFLNLPFSQLKRDYFMVVKPPHTSGSGFNCLSMESRMTNMDVVDCCSECSGIAITDGLSRLV